MDLVNKNFSNLIYIVIIGMVLFVGFYLFIKLIPLILLAVAGVWGYYKFKNWRTGRKFHKSDKNCNIHVDIVDSSEKDNFSKPPIIDVEYEEVK